MGTVRDHKRVWPLYVLVAVLVATVLALLGSMLATGSDDSNPQAGSGGETKQLAGWLPPDVRNELTDQTGHASGFDKRNFLEKVGGMVYTVDLDRVEKQVRAALQVASASAPAGERDDLIAQLPPELGDLFR